MPDASDNGINDDKNGDLPSNNDGTSRKSSTLGKERNNFGDREDQVTAHTS